ncbi:D-alanyl-D-alanine-carboxypeptidase/D-alanyl-D-alanine-endopeptidase [Amorphus suaedae]
MTLERQPRKRTKGVSSAMKRFFWATAAIMLAASAPARADDPFLTEMVGFNGAILYFETGVPGLVIGAVRNGETAVAGFGEIREGSGVAPDGDTPLRIGSITKVFTGATLASLVVDGTVKFTDTLQSRIGWDVTIPSRDGKEIRLIDLATHTSGLPRELERPDAPADDPNATITKEAFIESLNGDPLLFAPGTSGIYSNYAYDLLAVALETAAGKPYRELLKERVLDPAGLTDTGFDLPADISTAMQGHGFKGEPLPDIPTSGLIEGSGGLYSTANNILRWIGWHLDRFSAENAEMRLLDHAAYIPRDALEVASGYDESGHMDAVGLGWVVMERTADRPTILQKAGGMQGIFVYMAFAPAHDVGMFVAVNAYDFSAAMGMAATVNEMIGTLVNQ